MQKKNEKNDDLKFAMVAGPDISFVLALFDSCLV